ncbi:SH3 domain-containing protein [Mycena alexandri]|uniref:SH3 domain-containing protein n=1 Tax=Mycena alexandri TaxID=1745969 RepID=A0AAD6X7I5_9AGAR|nr:SH3 domain-containing protein [Mycena alexandri]
MSEAALLAHVVSQVESNVNFLVSQNYITQSDASVFLAKLPSSGAPQPTPAPASYAVRKGANAPAAPAVAQARALWPYNENGQDADDLSFSAGDIIEVVKEENADWWMGRFNGKQALFPSAYVEKIAAPSAPAAARNLPPALNGNAGAKPAYRPAAMSLRRPGGGTNSLGLQQDPEQEKKKSKFGKYGNTMAHSAAGGVGFGAGSAIGGGLVRAIF